MTTTVVSEMQSPIPTTTSQPLPKQRTVADAHRRERIIEVAREEFSRRGYAGASIATIAARAGIQKSTVFHHFESKGALYDAAVRGLVRDVLAALSAAADERLPFELQLDRCFLALQYQFASEPTAARLFMRALLDGEPDLDGDISDESRGLLDDVVELVADMLDAGIKEGVVPATQDAKQLALSVLGAQFLFFASPEISTRTVGSDPYAPGELDKRVGHVADHVRRMLGLVPAA
jgi:AcrR family transcriptional regulator